MTQCIKIKQCFLKLNAKKAIGQDKNPLALIKTAETLGTTLSITINNSFKYKIFPNDAKVACVETL